MIPVKVAHLKVAAGTHEGRKGKNNEDNFSVSAFVLTEESQTPVLFAMVADGIGGHHAGEVASEMAVEMISQAVAESDASHPPEIMEAAILQANQAIVEHSKQDKSKAGMGTTTVVAWIIEDRLYIANVGDSVMYLMRGGRLRKITIDHTWVQEAINAGALTQEQARNHPHSNVIHRYLGSKKELVVDLRLRMKTDESDSVSKANQGIQLEPRDRLVLCSDGLSDMIEDSLIEDLALNNKADLAVSKMIDAANEAGGKDNITVVVIDMPEFKIGEVEEDRRERKLKLSCMTVGMIGLLIALALAALFYFTGMPVFFPTPTPTESPTETLAPTWTPRPTETDVAFEPAYTYTPEKVAPTFEPAYTFTMNPVSARETEAARGTNTPAASGNETPTETPEP